MWTGDYLSEKKGWLLAAYVYSGVSSAVLFVILTTLVFYLCGWQSVDGWISFLSIPHYFAAMIGFYVGASIFSKSLVSARRALRMSLKDGTDRTQQFERKRESETVFEGITFYISYHCTYIIYNLSSPRFSDGGLECDLTVDCESITPDRIRYSIMHPQENRYEEVAAGFTKHAGGKKDETIKCTIPAITNRDDYRSCRVVLTYE